MRWDKYALELCYQYGAVGMDGQLVAVDALLADAVGEEPFS